MTTSLGSVCKFLNGGTPSKAIPEYFEGDIPWITSADISGPIANFARSFITDEAVKNSAVNKVAAGAVLLVTRTGVGKVAVAANELCFSQDITALLPDDRRLEASYLVHFLRTKKDFFLGLARGATIKGITRNVVSDLAIPLPSLLEQRRIAAILDQADALRAKRRKALAQLDSLTQSIFIEMFGDPRANERNWPVAPIGSFISGMRGGAALEPEDFTESGFPILHKGAIRSQGGIQVDAKKKTFASHEYAASKPNCIADRTCLAVTLRDLVPSGPSIGLVVDLRHGPYDHYLLAQGAYAFKLDSSKVVAEYFVHLSNAPTFRYVLLQNAVGSTQIHIRTPIYLAIAPPVPPIALQREFAKKIECTEVLKKSFRTSIAELDTLFASLQRLAFAGEL
jgi:type I restriction enzyme S subunit